MRPSLRLFVAIPLDRRITDELCACQGRLRDFDDMVKWAKPENMHLTLKFLGDVEPALATKCCEAAREVASATGPFEVHLGGCGVFPSRGPVRVVWAGIECDASAMSACHDLCEAAFERLGFPRATRAFSPHLTLGRVREDHSGGRLRETVGSMSPAAAAQAVEAIHTIQSTLSPRGPQYTTLARAPVGG